jgi:hypothetical protein
VSHTHTSIYDVKVGDIIYCQPVDINGKITEKYCKITEKFNDRVAGECIYTGVSYLIFAEFIYNRYTKKDNPEMFI